MEKYSFLQKHVLITGASGGLGSAIAKKVIEAVQGSPGEVWPEFQGKWFATAARLLPKFIERRLATLRNRVIQKKLPQKRSSRSK